MSNKDAAKGGITPSFNDEFTSRAVRFPLIMDEMQRLLGEVLTIIDAAIHDPRQNKATKDLIKQRFGHAIHDTFWHFCYANDFDLNVEAYYQENIVPGVLKHSELGKIAPPLRRPSSVDFPELG
jgi:hypothetical protein